LADSTQNSKVDTLSKDFQAAWEALNPIRQTWEDKEKSLLAQANDSFSGSVIKTRITDAALSTLSFERSARVAAQLPTGKVYPTGKKDEGKARLANIVLQRYIIPNANAQKDMLVKQRLSGVYASVYGSMPIFVDYRVDDDYIGPDCWLIDPRSFAPQPGRNSIQECDWVMISTIKSIAELKTISKRKTTNWDKEAVNKLIKLAEESKPSKYNNADKDSYTSSSRYSKELAKGEVELVTKYEAGNDGHWVTFAPDFSDVGVLRDIKNPHKSGKIPVFMRDCFPLLNSIYGLGDFERGMKIQKAKDSLLALRLEFVKNKVFPPLKIDTSKATVSTIKYGAGRKWLVTDMNAVQAQTFGNESDSSFQSIFSVLNTIQQNQFGTSDTSVNADNSGNPSFGKTPQALKMLESRENARDTWDRFMHEQTWEDVYEYMINLLCVNMEKPINFQVFEGEIRELSNEYGDDVLSVIAGNKIGNMTVAKKMVYTDKGFTFTLDGNSSMRQDDEAQFEALMSTFNMMNSDPNMPAVLQQYGVTYDKAEHLKKIFIAAGVNDWERILQETDTTQSPPEQKAMMGQQQAPMQQEQPIQQEQPQIQPQSSMDMSQFQDPEVMQYAQAMLGGSNG
jgi:hypothetical protein